MLVRIVKDWDSPNLMRQTPNNKGSWGEFQFTLEPVEECDVLLVFNAPKEDVTCRCPAQNVWALLQEPYEPAYFAWMRKGHQQFNKVFTHHPPNKHPRYVESPPMVPWHVEHSYDALTELTISNYNKREEICWVTSSQEVLPGHRQRMRFLDFLKNSSLQNLKLYGRGLNPIDDKFAVLNSIKYAIAIENYCGHHYWTEKVTDCWLSYSLPFYYGCLNLEDYFPKESFVRIDLLDFEKSLQIIQQSLDNNEYEKRLDAICEARQLVLEQHQFFPWFASIAPQYANLNNRTEISLRRWQESRCDILLNKLRQRYDLLLK